MNKTDMSIILLYFVVVLGAGFWFRKRASKDIQSYFLGGKRIHWSLLSMSGAVSNFDITGTMWMVAAVYLLGMKSWWYFQMPGFMVPAFCLAFIGKWVRRSNVMTGAEWMITRFGEDRGGQVARFAYAVLAVVTCVSFIGYAFQGIGKFAQVYIPIEGLADYLPIASELLTQYKAHTLGVIIFALTTIYIVFGGLYGVIFTDMIQTVILTLAALLIGAIAYQQVTPELLQEHLSEDRFESLEEFASLTPVWRMDQFEESSMFHLFGAMTIAWLLKAMLLGAGGPAQLYDLQRYLAAKDPRDAAKIAMLWPFFQSVRWLMVMAITLLAITGVGGVSDAEKVMPMVLQQFLPTGLRGLVIAGLLAAFMSTFSSTVNSGASYVVRDLWQPLFRPTAPERELIRTSYLATIGIVVVGIGIGWNADSITKIFNWIMMGLGSAVVVPNVLRWYWWRLNGWGYAAGIFGGIGLSLLVPYLPDIPAYVSFPVLCLASFVACILGSFLTSPVDRTTLENFFRSVRPFGFWGPVRQHVPPETKERTSSESAPRGVVNTVLGIILISGLYLFPCYLVGHWHNQALFWIAAGCTAGVTLYFTWYRHLPPSEPVTNQQP